MPGAIKANSGTPGVMYQASNGDLSAITLLDTNPLTPTTWAWEIEFWPDNISSAPAIANATGNPATFTPPAAGEWYVVKLTRTGPGAGTDELAICIPDSDGNAIPCPGLPADTDATKTIVNKNAAAKAIGWAGGVRATMPGLSGSLRKAKQDAATATTANATNTQAVNTAKIKYNAIFQGAIGDGVADDQPAISAAISALSMAGGGILYLPKGTYRLGMKLSIPDNIILKGDGIDATVLKATAGPSNPWTNVSGGAMVEFRGTKNSALEDLTVHGNGSLRTPGSGGDPSTDTIDLLIIFAATINCRLERIRITEGGYAASTSDTPSGPNILLIAKDTANDLGGQFGTVANQDCRGNAIRNCVIDDNSGATRVAKGIGIITDFGMIAPLAHDYSFNLSRRQTTIGGSVSASTTNIPVTNSHGFAIGDSIRIERASTPSIFDHGNVTAIPDATHVTIDTGTVNTYSVSDKFGISRDAISAYGPGGTQAASFRGRAVDQAGDGRGRIGVATTVRASMSASVSVIKATAALNVALGDTIRVSRAADHTLYDEGVVTAIASTGDITFTATTARTYALNDLVNVTAFSSDSGFNGGDYFANHAEANVIEDNTFTGVFNLYAIGLQGGGACRNVVQRNLFKSVRALGCVLVDKGAYANTVIDNYVIDHQRDSVFLSGSPIATFVDRALAGYYGFDNHFERNRVAGFVGTLEYDAPFAVGENAIRDIFRKNVIDGATVPSNLGMGFMIGQGNIDVIVSDNTVRDTNYGIFCNLGGAPLVPSSGGDFSDNTLDVTHQSVQLTANSGLAAGGSWIGSVKIHDNRVTGTSDVSGQIAVDSSVSVALLRGNYVERKGSPGAGHIGLSVAAQSGIVGHNVAKNHDIAYSFADSYQGLQHDNLALGSASLDVQFLVTKTPLFTRLQSALPQATTRIVEVVSTSNIASLSGAPVTIDGISIPAGLDVLLTGQSTGAENIIWTVRSGAWTPSYDLQDGAPAGGIVVLVKEGTANHDSGWICTNDTGADIVGTSSLTWSLLNSTSLATEAAAAYAAAVTNATPNNAASALVQRDGSGNFAAGVITATDLDNVAATVIRVGFNTLSTKLGTPGGNLSLFGGTLVTQPTRAGQLTDSTTGTPGTTLAAAPSGTVYATDFPTIINWIASLAAKYNSLEGKISAAGTGIGVTQ